MDHTFFVVCFSTMIATINPFGALPSFLAMTSDLSARDRKPIVLQGCLVAFITLCICSLAGSLIFRLFSISLPAFKIAGGILLFKVALDMLQAKSPRTKQTPEEKFEGISKAEIAIFPLAIPLLAGPGAIASVFMLSERANGVLQHLIVFASIFLILSIAFIVLRSASKIQEYLGRIGLNVMTRLMGLILAAISVQFVIDGILLAFPMLGRAG